MSVDQDIFVDGHVSQQVLEDLARHPGEFDDDTVEDIWQHLDECQDCVANYETARDGHVPKSRDTTEVPGGDPPPVVAGSIDDGALDPDDLTEIKVKTPEADGDNFNGLMPVGDDPSRNGLPDEYKNGDRPRTVLAGLESSIDAIHDGNKTVRSQPDEFERDDGKPEESEPDGGGGNARPTLTNVPEIEGLITGEVIQSDEEVDPLETESAADASVRIKQERADHVELPDDDETGDGARAPEAVEDGDDVRIDISDPGDGRREVIETPLVEPAAGEEPPRKETPPKPTSPKPVSSKTAPRIAQPVAVRKSEPLEDLLNSALAFLTRPKNAIIAGSAILVVAAAIIAAVVFTGGEEERLNAGWEPLDVVKTRTPLQEVLIRRMTGGRIRPAYGPDVTLDFRGVDRLVIAVDLDFIKGSSATYELIVRNPAGLNVFQEPIPQIYIDDGRFFLRLVPEQFEMGETYKLELITHRADQSTYIVAESVFDIVK
jgi:hypothetical protein